ncbi:MAG TPA: hypothetical protein VIC55_09740 [Gemmatimonadaceae bacterium]|jgi:hypothetical protein
MRPRVLAAGTILALWAGGLAVLARRQRPGGEAARLARAALFVSPGADYYVVSDSSHQIGFASSTIDTSAANIQIVDFVEADMDSVVTRKRFSARMTIRLSRTLLLKGFRYELGADAGPYAVTGAVLGDSVLVLTVRARGTRTISRRIPLHGPLFLPTMVPMVIALGDRPRVGQSYSYDIFDPLTDSTAVTTIAVRAESLFVLPDSATLDTRTGRWTEAHVDTVRAWRIEDTSGGRLTGWIDASGRMVEAQPFPRMRMRRSAYELAYSNWSRSQPRPGHPAGRDSSPIPSSP